MKINPNMSAPPMQGIGASNSAGIVDKIVEAAGAPVEAAKRRREGVNAQRNEYNSLSSMLGELGSALDGLKSPMSFRQVKFESSHPDIIDGAALKNAALGSYELEVKDLARASKQLAYGFKDVDKTEVGFGFMGLKVGDNKEIELQIDPGSTLRDVADKINASASGVRASIVNTGITDEPYRLLVASEKTGEAAAVRLDADTTFLDFKEQVKGRNLDLKFEDVDISRASNKVGDLVEGLQLNAKKAAPGTKVQVNVATDVDATVNQIKGFTEKYNKVTEFVGGQYAVNKDTGRAAGKLAADGSIRSVMRSLQANVAAAPLGNGKFKTLADVGITTNAKTGSLNVDEAKLKAALTEDYDGVSKIFTRTESGVGIAEKLSSAVKAMQDPQSGVVKSRMRGLDRMIKDQDSNIERQTQRLDVKRAQLERQFSSMDQRVATMNQQSEFMAARMGSGGQ